MSVWTWDANHFTFDDETHHTFDGWHDDLWTWDANHFTFDDNLNHTFDGWHDDSGIVVVEDDGGGATIPYPEIMTPERRRRNSLIMLFAKEYMKRIH